VSLVKANRRCFVAGNNYACCLW